MQKSSNVKPSQWSPELIIQLIKEFVCASLGTFLIVFTVLMANNTFGMVGDPTKLSNAKDLLLLLISLSSVILGYYFGRTPADARASQAMKQATVATAHAYEVGDGAGEIGAHINKMRQDIESIKNQQNGQNTMQKIIADMQNLSDECQKLSDIARMLPA